MHPMHVAETYKKTACFSLSDNTVIFHFKSLFPDIETNFKNLILDENFHQDI